MRQSGPPSIEHALHTVRKQLDLISRQQLSDLRYDRRHFSQEDRTRLHKPLLGRTHASPTVSIGEGTHHDPRCTRLPSAAKYLKSATLVGGEQDPLA